MFTIFTRDCTNCRLCMSGALILILICYVMPKEGQKAAEEGHSYTHSARHSNCEQRPRYIVRGTRRLLIPSRTLFSIALHSLLLLLLLLLCKSHSQKPGQVLRSFVPVQTVRVKDQPSSWVNYSRQNFHRDKPESLTLNGTRLESVFSAPERKCCPSLGAFSWSWKKPF